MAWITRFHWTNLHSTIVKVLAWLKWWKWWLWGLINSYFVHKEWWIQVFKGRQPQKWECQFIILAIFSRKLYEIEKNGQGGGHVSSADLPLDPPMITVKCKSTVMSLIPLPSITNVFTSQFPTNCWSSDTFCMRCCLFTAQRPCHLLFIVIWSTVF